MPAIDDSAKLEVLEAIGEALHLGRGKVTSTPEALRSSAEALLLISSDLWAQASLIRKEQVSDASFAGLHPVLQAIMGMDQVVWDTIARLRPKFVKALKEKSQPARDFMLKSVAVALAPRGTTPVQPASTFATASADDETDAKSAAESFYRNYLKHRPARLKTQADVAKVAGVSIGTVAAIERMKGKPHQATVAKLASAFGVSVEDLLT